jgi:hypothetical protein
VAGSFRGKVRYFRPDKQAGLAVIDLPAKVTATLGGLKQMRVRGDAERCRVRVQHHAGRRWRARA